MRGCRRRRDRKAWIKSGEYGESRGEALFWAWFPGLSRAAGWFQRSADPGVRAARPSPMYAAGAGQAEYAEAVRLFPESARDGDVACVFPLHSVR